MNIPDYTLLQSCGKGAYGQVWLAQSQTNKLVALKYVANSQAGDREFEGLINYSKLPESPHLIRILHLGKLEDGFFYTMELADGLCCKENYVPETLAERLKRTKHLAVTEVMDLATAILDALSTLHDAGLVHRDVKPENILYVNGIPKLSDMGLVRSSEQSVTLGGTLGFIPPERLKPGKTSSYEASDDLYALGKVLYCALTGNAVDRFPSFPAEMIHNTLCCHLNQIILKACGNAEERFTNANDFSTALLNGTEQALKKAPPHKIPLLIAGGIFLILLSCFVTASLIPRAPQEIETSSPASQPVETKKETAAKTLETKKETAAKTEKKTAKIVPPEGAIHLKAGQRVNWKNLPWNPFQKHPAKKWEPEDFGGMFEAFGKNSVNLYIRDPFCYYIPEKGDGLHPDWEPGELNSKPVYARLFCSQKTTGKNFWQEVRSFKMPPEHAKISEKYGTLSLKEELPPEYVIRCRLTVNSIETFPISLPFCINTNNGPFEGCSWDLVFFPECVKIPEYGIAFFEQKIKTLTFANTDPDKQINKKSFTMEVVRTNQIFAIYLDDILFQYVPSGSPGGKLIVEQLALNAIQLEDWEIYELNPMPPHLPEERYTLPDKRNKIKTTLRSSYMPQDPPPPVQNNNKQYLKKDSSK